MGTINSTIISGAGAIASIEPLLADKKSILLVSDQNIIKLAPVKTLSDLLQANNRHVSIVDNVPPEPARDDVNQIMGKLQGAQFDLVVGVGGGSVLDVAKLLSVLCHTSAPTLEALLAGEKPSTRLASLLIPASAGTGSEATPNAILAIPEQQTKVGIISPVLLPDYVALLPELTTSMPAHIASSTGIDALCHLIECFTATIANPVSNNVALQGMFKLFRNIENAVKDPENLSAKLEMLWASYYGGVAINHAGTHLVHAMSYPLGGKYHLPHGVANAILLTPCMRFIRPAVVEKFAEVWDLIPDSDQQLSAEEKSCRLVDWFGELVEKLQLPASLEALGISPDNVPDLVDGALNVQRLIKNVPCPVSAANIQAIYETLFTHSRS